jgi:hypothetical protein
MTNPKPAPTLSFGLHCSICGADLAFLGAGRGVAGVMERARCWCERCARGFVLTVTMRAMNPDEEAAELGRGDPKEAPRLVPIDPGVTEPGPELGAGELEPAPVVERPPTRLREVDAARRAARSSVPVPLPPTVRHGTRTAYECYRCRCDPCTDDQRDQKRGIRGPIEARKESPEILAL